MLGALAPGADVSPGGLSPFMAAGVTLLCYV